MIKLSSRDRILAVIGREEPDHVPLNIDVHPSFAATDPIAAGWKDQFVIVDDLLELGTDPFISIFLPDPWFGSEVTVRSWQEKDSQTGDVLLGKEYGTPAGYLRQVIRETPDLYTWHKINRKTLGPIGELIDGVGLLEDVNPSRSIEFLLNDPKDLEKMTYLFQVPPADVLRKWRDEALFAKREAEKRGVLLIARRTYCGSAALWLCNAEKFILALNDNPDFVRGFLRIIQDWQNKLLDIVLDIGVDIVTRFGYYDTPDFWGVEQFGRFLAPLLEEESQLVHQAGAFHCQQQSKGYTQQCKVWKKLSLDILRDIDPVQGGENLEFLKKELGTTKTFWGGINADLMLVNSVPVDIEKTVCDIINLMAPGGGFVLAPIPALYSGVPWEKVRVLIEAWKKYRTYPVGT